MLPRRWAALRHGAVDADPPAAAHDQAAGAKAFQLAFAQVSRHAIGRGDGPHVTAEESGHRDRWPCDQRARQRHHVRRPQWFGPAGERPPLWGAGLTSPHDRLSAVDVCASAAPGDVLRGGRSDAAVTADPAPDFADGVRPPDRVAAHVRQGGDGRTVGVEITRRHTLAELLAAASDVEHAPWRSEG